MRYYRVETLVCFIRLISRLLPQIKYVQCAKVSCQHGALDDVWGDCFGEFFRACFGGEVEHSVERIDEELIAVCAEGRVWATPARLTPGSRAFDGAVGEVVAADFCGSGREIPNNPMVEAANEGCVGAVAHHSEALRTIRDVADGERWSLVAAEARIDLWYFGVVFEGGAGDFHGYSIPYTGHARQNNFDQMAYKWDMYGRKHQNKPGNSITSNYLL